MASSSRPRSSNMSLTPRALRTFRALTRRREAFPLSVDSGSADISTLRLVLIGSPSRTPAELRVPLQIRLTNLRQRTPNPAISSNRSVKFTPGATALGRPLFRSPHLRHLRTLLQGGSALLEFSRDSPKTLLTSNLISALLKEATRPIPGFKPTAYLLSLPNGGSTAGYSRSIETRRSFTDELFPQKPTEDPYLAVIAFINTSRVNSVALPISLATNIGKSLTTTRSLPRTSPIKLLPFPRVSLLAVLEVLVKKRQF